MAPTPPKKYSRQQKQLQQLLSSGSGNADWRGFNFSGASSSNKNQDAVLQLVRQRPSVCRVVYDFSCSDGLTSNDGRNNTWLRYPLWRLFQLPYLPSLQLIYTVHQAHPVALYQTDPQGNSVLHSLCANARAGRTESKALLATTRYVIGVGPSLLKSKTHTSGATPLHIAARFGTSLDVVRLLVEAYPAALSTTTAGGETPLHWACQNSHLSLACALVPFMLQQRGVSVLATNRQGETALHVLLNHHRQSAPTDTQSFPSRHARSTARLISIIQSMLDHDPSQRLMHIQDCMGRVPLHLALSFGSFPLAMVKYLVLQKPATLCTRDMNGFTPVHQACLYPAQLGILRYLVRGKISLSPANESKPVVFSGICGGIKALHNKRKPDNKTDRSPTDKSVDKDDDDSSTKYTISVTSASSTPASPAASLSTASSAKPTFFINTMLEPKILHSTPNDFDDFATQDEDEDDLVSAMLSYLLADDDDNAMSYAPTTCTSVCTTRVGDDDDDNTLLQSLFLRLPNRAGALPLHVACEFWTSLEVVQMLVKEDPQTVRQVDRQGCTPLHLACANRAPNEMLRFLVQEYPEALYVEDNKGRLPLHVALEMLYGRHHAPSKEIVQLLMGRESIFIQPISRGSIRMVTTHFGETAYDIAVRQHAPADILSLLEAPRPPVRTATTAARKTLSPQPPRRALERSERQINLLDNSDSISHFQRLQASDVNEAIVSISQAGDDDYEDYGSDDDDHHHHLQPVDGMSAQEPDWQDLYDRLEI